MSDESAESQTSSNPVKDAVKMSLGARLRAYFFAGILITAPVSITFYIAWKFIDFVDRQVTPFIPQPYNPLNWGVPGAGLVIIGVSLTLIGALTAGFAGRVWVRFSDAILARMPVLNGIYGAVKQLLETVLAQKSNAFREVALVEYPRKGIWTIAFITGGAKGEVANRIGDDHVAVYVPTTPNPTSGFLLFLPKTDVHVLDMTVDEGLKLVISLGILNVTDKNALPAKPSTVPSEAS